MQIYIHEKLYLMGSFLKFNLTVNLLIISNSIVQVANTAIKSSILIYIDHLLQQLRLRIYNFQENNFYHNFKCNFFIYF